MMTSVTIKLRRRLCACASGPHQRPCTAGRLTHQPETIAADVIHMRIDRGN